MVQPVAVGARMLLRAGAAGRRGMHKSLTFSTEMALESRRGPCLSALATQDLRFLHSIVFTRAVLCCVVCSLPG